MVARPAPGTRRSSSRGGQRVVARLLPLARLTEVVLHHVDLDIGFGVTDVDDETAEWLLEWSSYRLGARDEFPRLELVSDTGFHTALGSSGGVRRVTGSSPALLGWLTGRGGPDLVQGSDGLVLPGLDPQHAPTREVRHERHQSRAGRGATP